MTSCCRCAQCGFRHGSSADELARCESARDLGLRLRASLEVQAVPANAEAPRGCLPYQHIQVKASEAAFLLGTKGWAEWDDGVDVLCLGHCRKCGSTLAIKVRNSDKRLALAVEALKGDQ